MKFAIIAGTGYDNFERELDGIEVITPYGKVNIGILMDQKTEIAILNRHGKDHSIPPHQINYRANIAAFAQLGVKWIYGICAVGSLKGSIKPGDIVLINDFLDMTKTRITSFYDGKDGIVKHLETSNVYSIELNNLFKKYAKGLNIHENGIYVCTEGPRFESKTEIQLYQMLHADVVGMTGIPEALLAKEKNMNYSCISYVTNFCTGVNGPITHKDFNTNVLDKEQLLCHIIKCFQDEKILQVNNHSVFL